MAEGPGTARSTAHWGDNQEAPTLVAAMNMFSSGAKDENGKNVTGNVDINSYDEPDEKWEEIEKQLPQLIAELPVDRPAKLDAAGCSVGQVMAAMVRDGGVLICNAVSKETCGKVISEMRPYIDAYPSTADGNKAKRPGCLLARSEASWDLIGHPLLLASLDGLLGRQFAMHDKEKMQSQLMKATYHVKRFKRHPYQLDTTQMVVVAPGGQPQSLHQDCGKHVFDFRGTLEPSVSCMWALVDYTETNGATRMVPGSHRWPNNRVPTYGETVPSIMPAGSVLLFSSHTWHAGGANTSTDTRYALNVDYSLGWLRQEENQYLACPPREARRLPPHLAQLAGYSQPGMSLGYFDNGQQPRKALLEGHTVMLSPKPKEEDQSQEPAHKKSRSMSIGTALVPGSM